MKVSVLFKRFLLPLFGLVLADQLVKGILLFLITQRVPLVADAFQIAPFPVMFGSFTEFFNLVFTWNPGTSFSLFRSIGLSHQLGIIVMVSMVIGFLGYHLLFRAKSKFEYTALLLIVGGALGNLIDRIRFGAVIDFMDFHVGNWHFPAFNVADAFITIGVMIYLYGLFRKKI